MFIEFVVSEGLNSRYLRYYVENKITVLCHPPYTPDLIPADYFIFSNLKLMTKSYIFDDIPAIKRTCTASSYTGDPTNMISPKYLNIFTDATLSNN